MIISASYRTDIPAFHGAWFRERLRAGATEVANPYSGKPYRVDLRPEAVTGFVFWTRNPAPFRLALDEVAARGHPFVAQVTITGYPRALDEGPPDWRRAAAAARAIAERFGRGAVVWRYDPILFSDLTPRSFHLEMFGRLAEALRGATDEVTVSFAQIYTKTRRNLDRAAAGLGFAWEDPADADKRGLLSALLPLANSNRMRLTLCSQPALLVDGISPAACIDAARLSRVAGAPVPAKARPHRTETGCACAESRDIGAYDTCPHGCVYCYAVRSRAVAAKKVKAQNVSAEMLG